MRKLGFIGLLGALAALVLGTTAPAAPAYGGGEILWDRYGVGHVFANSTEGLFYAYGFAQAKSHGEAVVKLYAQARGRAAEYYGPEELANDRWMAINAAAQLDFDLKNPASAGPPHVSQTGGDPEALVRDCDDEKTAFDRLESRRRSLGLEPQQVLSAASLAQEILRAWQSRQGGLSSGCR